MALSRRQLLVLSAATAAAAGCEGEPHESQQDPQAARPAAGAGAARAEPPATRPVPADAVPDTAVDAGPLAEYGEDRVYDQFRQEGFFLVRRDRKLFALSSVCTHKGCKVRAQTDGSYLCKCHGSRFDRDGKVTKPPAKRDLPRLQVAVDGRDHVLVNVEAAAAAASR